MASSVPASASCSRPSIPPQSWPWRPDPQSLDTPPLRQQVLNVHVAQREPEIKPHGMLDDGGWELMAGVRDWLHPGRLLSPLTERHCSRDNADGLDQSAPGCRRSARPCPAVMPLSQAALILV